MPEIVCCSVVNARSGGGGGFRVATEFRSERKVGQRQTTGRRSQIKNGGRNNVVDVSHPQNQSWKVLGIGSPGVLRSHDEKLRPGSLLRFLSLRCLGFLRRQRGVSAPIASGSVRKRKQRWLLLERVAVVIEEGRS